MVLPAKCLQVLAHRPANGQEALLFRLGSVQLGACLCLLRGGSVNVFEVGVSPRQVGGVVCLPLWCLSEGLLLLCGAGLGDVSKFVSHRITPIPAIAPVGGFTIGLLTNEGHPIGFSSGLRPVRSWLRPSPSTRAACCLAVHPASSPLCYGEDD